MNVKNKILFVDDEPVILESLRRMLHHMRNEWDMQFAHDAEEALAILRKEFYDVVVSDMRMPGMDGAKLLEEVQKLHPQTVRMILSGQADKNSFLRSMGTAHQFLSKPCNAETLKDVILRACSLQGLLSNPEIRTIISGLGILPSLPKIYLELTDKLQSPDSTLEDIGEIITMDIGIAAKILQLVNSAYFGLQSKVTDLVQALQVLGLDIVKALILSIHVFTEFKNAEFGGLSMERLWSHSLVVGENARKIMKMERVGADMEGGAFVSGLLHNIGKLVLASKLPERYREVLPLARARKIADWQAEMELFKATHMEVGAYLLRLWGLPDSVVEAVAYYRRPSICEGKVFMPLAAVHAADVLEYELHTSKEEGIPEPQIDVVYLRKIGLLDRVSAWRSECLLKGSV